MIAVIAKTAARCKEIGYRSVGISLRSFGSFSSASSSSSTLTSTVSPVWQYKTYDVCPPIVTSNLTNSIAHSLRSGPASLPLMDPIGILYRMPIPQIRPNIGNKEYKSPDVGSRSEIKDPLSSNNLNRPIIEQAPDFNAPVEKQAARLIVIRRSKMNKHKLRKLRKKMKFVWAKVRQRRNMRKEKAFLNSKISMIQAANQFDAKEYVASVIRKAKEEPIPRKWTDPLMPEWYKEQEMNKEIRNKRYQKLINLYINKSIKLNNK